LLGGDPWRDAPALHRRLAYVPGDVSLWPNLTGGEAIDLLGRARGGLDPARRADLIERFDLDPRKKGRAYSKGNRQKVALLLLDEPTSGLDPLMERVFTDYIRDEAREGRTVLLSSHILSEVEALCDHVSIIKAGRIVETGTLDELRHLHRTTLTAQLSLAPSVDLARLPGVHRSSLQGLTWSAEVDDTALSGVLAELGRLGVSAFSSAPPTLEELFVRHYDTIERREAAVR
jgi:ABC-2 type transport system ATP-binding protein